MDFEPTSHIGRDQTMDEQSTDLTPVLEEDEPQNTIQFPRISVGNETVSTDSMVTVRLSEPDTSQAEEVEEDSTESDITVEPTGQASLRTSFDILHGNAWQDEGYRKLSGKDEGERDEADDSRDRQDSEVSSFAQQDIFDKPALSPPRSRSNSDTSRHSDSSGAVDWVQLEKTEQTEAREEGSDESTAFLLARLEQENNALATDPRFAKTRVRKQSRPPSMHVLKKLVEEPISSPTRYSLLPNPPPMTELEFWAALVKDYPQTVQRLPTLTSNKIKAGVPPPLRGVVWLSMAGARDQDLKDKFDQLREETSPYENLIGKDIGRSFPGVEMFRDPNGEGQQMLGRVLKCFSLYDKEIGYCQGLGFIVGPLLMQMEDKDAFCVLVKLMENYDLRSCFLPNLSGLHLRIYQFQRLLDQHMPTVAAHFASLHVEAAYLSQWFLSLFAVTCPLPMLFRIYDVLFAEGTSETIMRVAMSLMKQNETKILASTEFEEVMHLLLSRALWEPYSCNADELVQDFMSFSSLVTHDTLSSLETAFKEAAQGDTAAWFHFLPDATAAASRFLGRLWTTATPIKSGNLTPYYPGLASLSRPGSFLRRSPSKQSLSTINTAEIGSEGTNSVGTLGTETTIPSRDSSAGDVLSLDSKPESLVIPVPSTTSKEDKDFHSQIEDLLLALTEMQRQNNLLTTQLQKEREDRNDDQNLVQELLQKFKEGSTADTKSDRRRTLLDPCELKSKSNSTSANQELQDLVDKVDRRLVVHRELRQTSLLETKQRLRESLGRSRDQLQIEISRSQHLSAQLDEQEKETASVRDQLKEAEARIEEEEREKQRLEQIIEDMNAYGYAMGSRTNSIAWSESDPSPGGLMRRGTNSSLRMSIYGASNGNSPASATASPIAEPEVNPVTGLRELRLGRKGSLTTGEDQLPKRNSSLATPALLSKQDHIPASEDEILVELVNAKTSEAIARQELEEVKSKLEAMRRMLGVPPTPAAPAPIAIPSGSLHRPSASEVTVTAESPSVKENGAPKFSPTPPKVMTPGSVGAGIANAFWGWSKRSASSGTPPASS